VQIHQLTCTEPEAEAEAEAEWGDKMDEQHSAAQRVLVDAHRPGSG